MNVIAQINKAKEFQANEILEKIDELFEELEFHDRTEDFYERVRTYIRKEHLYLWDK